MATLRQKLAASKMSENIRNGKLVKPMGQILKESGYSESVCKHPDRVTGARGWPKLEIQIGPEHTFLEKNRRNVFFTIFTILLLPIILGFIFS